MDDFSPDFGAPDVLDRWRLCDELSVVQAALLILGKDPSGLQDDVDNKVPRARPRGYDAAKTALTNAVNGKRLAATVVDQKGEDGLSCGPDWHRTTVMVEDLRVWLTLRGIKTGFFFPSSPTPDYLSQSHDHYSPKLAAAIEAWKAVSTDADLRVGKTVKQALIVWLRQHGNDFGLSKEDGNPNEQGIEEVAKIANWDTKGGAPKTPL